ncbi:PDZ domain-containing protein 8 [Bombina bombina]|uniref:PDZ domain-containing protein 8 n=1 Tax=Bombina bombina TaxID=8345 RepID=UPI00235AA59A|nr:PDZ domain-containing protein 8 [Bombina bombina]
MVYVVLLSALVGCILTLLLQVLLLYRRQPQPVPGSVPPQAKARPVQPDPSLRDYLQSGADPPAETCQFLNAIFLFLFRELRDTALLRRWLTKKIKVEFEELLLTRTAGRLLEGLSLRDVSLGDVLPVFRSVRPLTTTFEPGLPDELSFEVELEYNGGFHLAIDVDLVFGKSAYLFVKLSRVLGRLRLVFTRLPFTHWSFCFLEDPLIDFEVQSQFEGRPMPQLTSIIVNQLKKVIKRKHTLPNYKIRYKPFFPFQVMSPAMEFEDRELTLQDMGLTEGRLKVSLIDCSRLLIFGSYDQETPIHCTLELSNSPWKEKTRSSIKTAELIKGSSQSLGLIMVQARDGDTGHVCVETVTPNSPAAAADLKKGDRLIAIGGIKVTSSVQASKLIKQAGDRVLVFYERPVGQGGGVNDNFTHLEDSAFAASSYTSTFEEDAVSIGDSENKEQDLEFEDLAYDIKLSGDVKDDISLPINQSPKRIVANLNAKPLGSISPILNRKLNLPAYQKPQTKVNKVVAPETQETLQPSRPLTGSSNKPPVPPRPQIKLTLANSEIPSALECGDVLQEKAEKPLSPPSVNGDRVTEKPGKQADPVEELTTQKSNYLKQDAAKDKISESSISTKDSADDQNIWESPEILYKNRLGRWTRSSSTFEVEGYHRYLNVALWCRDSFKTGSLSCVGHVSIKLEEIALECLTASSLEYLTSFRLNAPEPKATVSRTALRSLSMHKGFNEKLCYGDITLSFKFLMEGESENSSMLLERERDVNLLEEIPTFQKEEAPMSSVVFTEAKHNFQDTQFQNSTLCDHCKRKVWTKAASQCMICGYVCHKKCQEKCLTENPYCVAIKRVDLESKSLGNRTAGITRHIINTSSRLLNLRQAPKVRQPEQGSDLVDPSPKHTPNTSDNESSDTETCGTNSPSKRASGGTGKLVPKEGGLDDSVFIAVKEIGRDLYRGLPSEERIQKLEFMLDKLQNEIDQELEHNNSLVKEEKETTDTRRKTLLCAALTKSGERLQALTLLMIHYRAGIEDMESLENSCLAQPRKMAKYDEGPIVESEADNNEEDDICQVEAETLNYISEEKLSDSPEVI